MRKKILKGLAFSVLGFYALQATAALSPQARKQRDLARMVGFVKQYPRVMSGLEIIDIGKKQVRFGKDCVLQFERSKRTRPPGWVGPRPSLQLASSNCDLGERKKSKTAIAEESKARTEKQEMDNNSANDDKENLNKEKLEAAKEKPLQKQVPLEQ